MAKFTMMRSLEDIEEMLRRFDVADENGDLDDVGSGVRTGLMWVLTQDDNETLEDLLPDEEVCPDCESPDCSGASGGECDDAVEEEVVEPDEPEGDEGGHYRH